MDLTVLNCMKTRRSIRGYRTEQIPDDVLNLIIEAGVYAASGRGLQSAKLIVVQDPETRALLSQLNAEYLKADFDPFFGAPTIVAVVADKNSSTYIEDGALAIGNMMVAAHSFGVGSCWVHRAREVFSDPRGRALLQKWGVSDDYVGIGHCALGYAATEPKQAAPRKPENVLWVR
ncbi:MAG: nitroreductase [Planctomycetia bacterium]|nr:nitroreductase [Planctomycetia bacterium]